MQSVRACSRWAAEPFIRERDFPRTCQWTCYANQAIQERQRECEAGAQKRTIPSTDVRTCKYCAKRQGKNLTFEFRDEYSTFSAAAKLQVS